jgi:hypothetical protein
MPNCHFAIGPLFWTSLPSRHKFCNEWGRDKIQPIRWKVASHETPIAYQPIEERGIIGNMYTKALVGLDGTMDWFGFPHHDSPIVFGVLLDDELG